MNQHLIPQVIRQELVAPHELRLGPMASGGLSGAWIWHCQSALGPAALRGWPSAHPTAERLRHIHMAMRIARQRGMENIPAIYGNRQGGSFTSDGTRLWELTQWMPGVADYPQAPSTQRLQSALRALAKLHLAWSDAATPAARTPYTHCSSTAAISLPASFLAASVEDSSSSPVALRLGLSPTVAERRQKLELSLQRQQAWQRCLHAVPAHGKFIGPGSILGSSPTGVSALVDSPLGHSQQSNLPQGDLQQGDSRSAATATHVLALQTLMHLAALGPDLLLRLCEIQSIPVRLHYVLRDVWSDHILFTGDRVTGIVDFGAARVDEPAADVARLLGSLEPLDDSRWLVGWQAYHANNPHVEIERVRLLDRVGTLLAAVQWLQWLVIEPRQFDAPLQQLLSRWRRLLQRLEVRG